MNAPIRPTATQARAVLAAQPFSVLLGTRLTSFGPEGATLELDVRDELRQQHGIAHGGVLSYLLDNAITFAAGAVLGPDLVTGGFTIDYLRPATGDRLRARAVVIRAGTRIAVVTCDLDTIDSRDGTALLCAVGQGRATPRRAGD